MANMSVEEDIWRRVGSKYGALLRLEDKSADEIRQMEELAQSVPHDVALAMVASGASWRERLAGLVLAKNADSAALASAILANLREPRGLVITPSCAALAALSRCIDVASLLNPILDQLDSDAFGGELGWALDRVRKVLVGEAIDSSTSPNDGQVFSHHFSFYRGLYSLDE